MTYLDLNKERALNSEDITETLFRHYQSAIEADLVRFEAKFNQKFAFKPDNEFWIKAGERFSSKLALNDPYYVVFSVFYTEIMKELYDTASVNTPKNKNILEYGLSSLTREQFNYLINKYYLCTSNADEPDTENTVIQKFAFHNSFSTHRSDILKRYKAGESLNDIYMPLLSLISDDFINQIGVSDDIKPTLNFYHHQSYVDRRLFHIKGLAVMLAIAVLGLFAVLLLSYHNIF